MKFIEQVLLFQLRQNAEDPALAIGGRRPRHATGVVVGNAAREHADLRVIVVQCNADLPQLAGALHAAVRLAPALPAHRLVKSNPGRVVALQLDGLGLPGVK